MNSEQLTFAALIFLLASPVAAVAQDAPVAEAAPVQDAPVATAEENPVQEGMCDGKPFSMQITVQNVKSDKGTITLDVHDEDPEKFLKSGGKLARIRVPAVPGETTLCVTVPRAGIYALAAYHDRNANMKMDKTWIGLPSEPFGLSNNPPPRLAVPKHKDSAFEVNGPLTQVIIHLRD